MLNLESTPLLELVDASYDTSESRPQWALRIIEALMAVTSSPLGAAFHFTSSYQDGCFHVDSMAHDATTGAMTRFSTSLSAAMSAPGAINERLLGRTHASLAASVSGLGERLAQVPGWRNCWPDPVVDSLGFIARDVDGNGFCACVGLDHVGRLTARESTLLAKLATHIGAGDRLRRANHLNLVDDAEAVLTPGGKVLHASEHAKDKRDELEDGRQRRDQARRTTNDVEKALEVWRGLVAGRWSLVDHFDTDGKRLLLAMKNTPRVDRRADLTPRERRVCALAAVGHRDKEIAYMLGLSLAAVTASLHRGRRKLNVSSRADLAKLWRAGS